MAYGAGITRYRKKKWLDELATLINAGSCKIAFLTGSPAAADANTDPTTPLTYANVSASEISASGTGYTTGGYVCDEAAVVASGNAYNLQFSSVGAAAGTVVTGAGTIASGTYTGVLYTTTDSNRVEAIIAVNVTQGSAGGTMTFTIPAAALAIT